MNTCKKLAAVEAELAALYAAPVSEENEDRIEELEEEKRSLVWELDARIY